MKHVYLIISVISIISAFPCFSENLKSQFIDTSVIAFLKEEGSLLSEKEVEEIVQDSAKAKDEKPHQEKLFSFGPRVGLFYPGASSQTGTFVTGPDIGIYVHYILGPGILQGSLDITNLKAPSDVDDDYEFLAIIGGSYIFQFETFHDVYVGGGMAISTPNDLTDRPVMLTAIAGKKIWKRFDVSLNFYIPLGRSNNRFMIGMVLGLRY